MPATLRMNFTTPLIITFVRHLIVALNIGNIVWLYNEESRPIIDSLLQTANSTQFQALDLRNELTLVSEILNGLPIGPHYAIVYVVTSWHTIDTYKIQGALKESRHRTKFRHIVLYVDGLAPKWFEMLIPSALYEQIISVRFPDNCSADQAVITNENHLRGFRDNSAITVADFLANGSLLAHVMRHNEKAHPILRVTVNMSPPDCMSLAASFARYGLVLFGRDVAIFRLLAERTRTTLKLERRVPLFSPKFDGFHTQTFILNLSLAVRPLWLRPFITAPVNVYAYVFQVAGREKNTCVWFLFQKALVYKHLWNEFDSTNVFLEEKTIQLFRSQS